MNLDAREYVVNNLQPWRFPEELKKLHSQERIHAVPISPYIERYFKQFYDVQASQENTEILFESELIKIYETLIECLPEETAIHLNKHAVFGACHAAEPRAYVTNIENAYAIMWDFRLDNLLTEPTVLSQAMLASKPLIDSNTGAKLFNICNAYNFYGRGRYYEPILSAIINRPPINHMVWGMSVFIIAHELAHVLLGHFEDATLAPMKCMTLSGPINTGIYNRSQQQEFDADILAINLISDGIQRGILHGYASFQDSPFNALYEHIRWLFTILECCDLVDNIFSEKEISDTHPEPEDRAEFCLNHLRNLHENEIDNWERIDFIGKEFVRIATDVPCIMTFDHRLHHLFPDYYFPDRYKIWLRQNGFNIQSQTRE